MIHSTTKYLSGHGDISGGAVLTNDDNLYEIEEAELAERGIEILPRSLIDAVRCLEEDDVVLQALGPDYGTYYADVKKEEWRQYHNTVSEWEADNYLGLH